MRFFRSLTALRLFCSTDLYPKKQSPTRTANFSDGDFEKIPSFNTAWQHTAEALWNLGGLFY